MNVTYILELSIIFRVGGVMLFLGFFVFFKLLVLRLSSHFLLSIPYISLISLLGSSDLLIFLPLMLNLSFVSPLILLTLVFSPSLNFYFLPQHPFPWFFFLPGTPLSFKSHSQFVPSSLLCFSFTSFLISLERLFSSRSFHELLFSLS